MGVVSNNVNNANTVGYTRQVIVAENQVLGGQGQGVLTGNIIRYADQTLQTGMDQQASNVEYNRTVSNYFAVIEKQFGKLSVDGSATLDEQINDMFTQLNNLIQDPTLSSNRVTFKNSTVQTVERLNKLYNDLSEQQISIDDEITTSMETVNTALKNISDLNDQIAQIERANGNSSQLKDMRQQEIAKVSQYMQVTTTEKADGVVHVSLNSGKVLVDSTHVQFTRTEGSPFGGIGFNRVVTDGTLSNTTQVLNSEDLSSGSFGALVELRDNELPDLMAQLDNFAVEFIEQFNNIHAQGSAVPPPNSLGSIQHPNGGSTLLTDIGLTVGSDFDISIVDKDGKPVGTTAGTEYTGSLSGSTIAGTTSGTFDPAAYLEKNGDAATIEGTSNVEYLGGGMYRLTDPSGGVHTATLNPGGYPVAAGTPAQLDFGNGMVLNVDPSTTEPTVGPIGSIETQLTGGPIRVEAGDTLDDLANKINSNPGLAGEVTATVVNGSLQITANNSANGVVLGNDPTGDTFNKLGFNRYFEGTGAGDITVSDSILNDLNNIATGRMREDGGFTNTNNENAVALANLQNMKFSFDAAGGLNSQEATLTEYFVSITSSFAAEVSANNQQGEFNESLYNDFNARVQSLSGVNTDEEFANLIVYQRSFEAASRMIQTVDEMLEMLINMV
jgi:flagellar hook-associated protein 1 FlgK